MVITLEEAAAAVRLLGAAGMLPAMLNVFALATFEYVE
jgi:hypothetical protein